MQKAKRAVRTKRCKKIQLKKRCRKLQFVSNDHASITIVSAGINRKPIDGFSVLSRKQIEQTIQYNRHAMMVQPNFRNASEFKELSDVSLGVVGRTAEGEFAMFDAWEVFNEAELKHWAQYALKQKLKVLMICRGDDQTQQFALQKLVYETTPNMDDFSSLKEIFVEPGVIKNGAMIINGKSAVLFIDETQLS